MSKVLIISPEMVPIGDELAAGPGIRAWEIAKGLKRYGHEMALALPEDLFKDKKADDLKIIPWEIADLRDICQGFDCVIVPLGRADLSKVYAETVSGDIPTVADVYDPVLVEFLSLRSPIEAYGYLSEIIPLFKRADFFICANERQRYYYLGILNVLGRINPLTYDQKILEIVPYGVPSESPVHTKDVLRGKLVGQDDQVILWFSGIYPWFDAVTLVKAMPAIIKEVPRAKLVIMGGVHPRLHAPADEYNKTKNEAEGTGLLDKAIFFVDWRPYQERANWYLESDLAVCTYQDTLETLLSHRTRVIDLLWGGLPIVVSKGDQVSELITSHGCGLSVEVGNVGELVDAVISLLRDDAKRGEMSNNAKKLVEEKLTWDKVLKPLNEFCQKPSLAADRADSTYQSLILGTPGKPTPLMARVKEVYREEGLTGVVKRIIGRVRRKSKKV